MGLEEDLQKAQENKSKGNQELAALKERIAKGESLGNPIKDYLFVFYGTTDFPAVEERLQKLSETIQAHNGQQAMVLYIQSKLVHEGGCWGGPEYNKEVIGQQFGVLDGELTFNLENGGVVLPTSKHVQKGEDPYLWRVDEKSWKLKEECITIPGYNFTPSHFFGGDNLPKPELLLGDEVELYFSTGRSYFESYLETRSQEWKKNLFELNLSVNEDYLAASTALGVEVPSRFKERYEAKLRQRKEDILEKIQDPSQVKHYLARALELNLHQEEREIELQPGIKMNVPEYLRAQCEKYKIKIPE